MKKARRITEAPHILSGWKEIANYLGRGVRTVQRYEWELGLPVRRPAGKDRGSVVATRVELDAWVAASPIRSEFKLMRAMPEYPPSAYSTLSTGVKEMARLRTQMQELGSELRTSMALLRQGISTLRGRVYNNLDGEAPDRRTDGTPWAGNAFDLFRGVDGSRKAS